jgi:hypothetical protein
MVHSRVIFKLSLYQATTATTTSLLFLGVVWECYCCSLIVAVSPVLQNPVAALF